MILRSAARTDVGRRRRANEDCYAIAAELGYFVVADGMGGHKAGQLASRLAAEAAVAALEALEGSAATLTEKLRCSIAAANREIYVAAQAKPEFSGMGTTLVSLLAAEGRVALAHVGDSRAYLIRGGRIRQLTDDHSVVGELVRRREITVLPDILANAGGVTVSYFEWVQNRQGYYWNEDTVNERLREIMIRSFHEVSRYSKQHGVNLRTAAYMLSIDRVAAVHRIRGIYA